MATFKQAVSIINSLTEEQVRDLIEGGSDPMIKAVGKYRLESLKSSWVDVVHLVEVSHGTSVPPKLWSVDEVQGRVEGRDHSLHLNKARESANLVHSLSGSCGGVK
jgi:hypothetical protein